MTRISVDTLIQNGNPCISGTRISVLDIVMYCDETSIMECVKGYGRFDRATALEALHYCSGRRCDVDGEHCGGCTLRPIQDGIKTAEDFVNRFEKVKFRYSDDTLYGSGSGIMYVHCAIEELEENWRGVNGWEVAERILEAQDE